MRQTVFFLIFFFAGFSCAQGLNHYIRVIKSGDTSEGRLYNVYVYILNQSVDAVPANGVLLASQFMMECDYTKLQLGPKE